MTKKNDFLKIVCTVCAICFIILVSAPLITLAIPTTTTQIVPTPQPESQPPAPIAEDTKTAVPEPTTNNKPEYDEFTVQQRQEQNLPTLRPTVEPYYGDKIIYLTFDDGPDPENTPIILDILKENKIKATFFVLGTEVNKYPELLKRIYDEGHAIGNHSYNHVYRELYQSEHTYIKQLHHNDAIIKSIINVRPHISRAPGGSAGSFTKAYWDLLKQQGYIEVGWNISSGDASSADAQQIVDNIIAQTQKNKFLWSHAILLMHDGKNHAETVKALPNIIKFYKDLGFEFQIITSKTPSAW